MLISIWNRLDKDQTSSSSVSSSIIMYMAGLNTHTHTESVYCHWLWPCSSQYLPVATGWDQPWATTSLPWGSHGSTGGGIATSLPGSPDLSVVSVCQLLPPYTHLSWQSSIQLTDICNSWTFENSMILWQILDWRWKINCNYCGKWWRMLYFARQLDS